MTHPDRPHLDPTTAALCADWWAERFMVDDKRAAFRELLRLRLETGDIHRDDQYGPGACIVRLEVDYDPRGTHGRVPPVWLVRPAADSLVIAGLRGEVEP